MKHAKPRARDLPTTAINAAIDGEVVAFRRFFEHYDPTVRWAVGIRIYRWPRLVPLYEDLVQEVWAYLVYRQCKVLRYYERNRNVPFWRFLAFLSAQRGWRLARRHLRLPELVEVPDLPEDEELSFVARMLSDDLVERLLARARVVLDAKDFELLEGHYVHGETIRDIAQRLGIRENAAHQRHGRLKKKLAALLEELLGEAPRGSVELVATLMVVMSLFGIGLAEASSDAEADVEASHG